MTPYAGDRLVPVQSAELKRRASSDRRRAACSTARRGRSTTSACAREQKAGVSGFSVWAGGGARRHRSAVPVDFVAAADVLIACGRSCASSVPEARFRHKAPQVSRPKLGARALPRDGAPRSRRCCRPGRRAARGRRRRARGYRAPRPAGATIGRAAATSGLGADQRPGAARRCLPRRWSLPLGDVTADGCARSRRSRDATATAPPATSDQNIVFRHCTARHCRFPRRAGRSPHDPGASLLTDVVACPGLDYCSLAVTARGCRRMITATSPRPRSTASRSDSSTSRSAAAELAAAHIADIGLAGM